MHGSTIPEVGLLIQPLIALAGIALPLLILYTLRWVFHRGRKRNPLTRDLLRSPGHSLRQQLEDVTLEGTADVACMMLVPSFATLVFTLVYRPQSGAWTYGVVMVLLIGGLGFFTIRLARLWRRRTQLRLALDGEMATGEELNQLMLRGYRVFHDLQAGTFNVDHVVVGPAGVFAVETKSRAKTERGGGSRAATVIYDGSVLRFPGWQGREALEQAKRQAEWLRKWLRNAVGEPVDVKAVLALPGWFVERKAFGDVIVINPKETRFLVETRGAKELAPESVQRIAYQLEQRCRDVEPLAYRDPSPEVQRRP
jgi:nuclease-like protein